MSPTRLRLRRFPALVFVPLLLALAPAAATAATPEAALVKRINASTHTASVSQVVELGGALYFTAERDHTFPHFYPTELYRTDGTLGGTTLVFDSVDPVSFLRVVEGQLLFQGSTATGQLKTYTSNGMAAGTALASSRLTAAGPNAVATTDGSLYSASLYSAGGGTLVKRAPGSDDPVDVLPGVAVYDYVALGDKVYVAGALTSGPFDERGGVWVTDGTPDGTKRLARPAGATYTSAGSLTATTDAVYFIGSGPGIGGGPETDDGPFTLYRATEAGITHITRPDGSRLDNTESPRAIGSKVTFHLREDGKNALWVTDGTPAGTQQLIGPDLALTAVNRNDADRASGGFVFTVRGGRELWRTDGTPAGTTRVGELPAELEPSELRDFTALGGKVWFTAFTGRYGSELWRADGTPAGTSLAFDLNTRPVGASISGAVRLGDYAYFQATDGALHPQLWRSNGTAAGTELVTSFSVPSGRMNPGYLSFTVAGDAIYVANGGMMASSLWKVTPNGTKTLLLGKDEPSNAGPGIAGITPWRNGIAFVADSIDAAGSTIWTSDGTAAGTKPLPGGIETSDKSPLRAFGDSLYYAAPTSTGEQLAKTDGTPGGTAVLTTFPGASVLNPITDIAEGLGGTPWFARLGAGWNSTELYRVDPGATSGAALITQSSSIGRPMTAFGDRVYFASYNEGDAAQSGIWSSDGTPAGTRLEEAGTSGAQVIGTSLTFIRSSGEWPNRQSSLWTTKTTFAAATRVDAGAGEVGPAFEASGHLLFAKSTEALGQQLFGVAPQAATPAPVESDPKPVPLDENKQPTPEQPQPALPTPTPTPLPTPTPTAKGSLGSIDFKARVARDRTAPYKFSLAGELKAKPGSKLSGTQCLGRARITILRGAKTVATKDTAVAGNAAGQCVFKLEIAVARGKLARRGSLKAKVAFVGSDQLAAFRAPGHVKLKYG